MNVEERGFCLVSQQIRKKITDGKIANVGDNILLDSNGQFLDKDIEKRIQPSSFEPTIGDTIFIIDTETQGLLRPQRHETVYKSILKLPKRQRQKFDITKGFELKRGFSYLIPLRERVELEDGEYIKSWPKSSAGRIFLNTRMLVDYHSCIDEANSLYKKETLLEIWLLVQPLTFNVIIYPGLTLNQLRFFKGHDARLAGSEIVEEFKKNPLVYKKGENGVLTPWEPIITDGLQVHLDLVGEDTEGVVGLRARNNPVPIDLSRLKEYDAEDYFEPIIKGSGLITIKRGDHCLVASKGILNIPHHLSAELNSYSNIGLIGPLHFAGFIDNGFMGDLVFEVRSDELSKIVLVDNMPLSKLDLYRTSEIPDKTYGEKILSNYQGQIGPRTAKYFKKFDFSFAARNYQKLSRDVLVQDSKLLIGWRHKSSGFEPITPEQGKKLVCAIEKEGFFHSRYDCETDEEVLQVLPYVIVFGPNHTVFSYIRAQNIRDHGEERLFGKHSVGVGGHIVPEDGPSFIGTCIQREMEEELKIAGKIYPPKLIGTLMAYDTPVDRVHFALVYAVYIDGTVETNDHALVSGKMMPMQELVEDPLYLKKYETWSRELVPYLPQMEILLRSYSPLAQNINF